MIKYSTIGSHYEMGEQLNINVKTTSAESPWSNRVVEKQNGIIGNMMEKVLSDVGCSLEVALTWFECKECVVKFVWLQSKSVSIRL